MNKVTDMSTTCLEEARAALRACDTVMARLIVTQPHPDPHTWQRAWCGELPAVDLFGSLLRQIVGQQISVGAARAILGRLATLFDGEAPTPARLLAIEPERLRSVGLSRQKISYARDLAQRIEEGILQLESLAELSDAEVRKQLTAAKGIGKWSADMVLLVDLGRPDVLPSGDLGIRKAVQRAYELPSLPSSKEVDLLGEKWRPHRSLATSYLYGSL
ncbi:MAG: DNA-3-methyladenine glycosylase 2 family protein [Rubrobacter sp.]|nr:DNA-3-methyladenine glycosylase 2 family protein [Rubrobacter sp.]